MKVRGLYLMLLLTMIGDSDLGKHFLWVVYLRQIMVQVLK